jgi:hypothetical protein
MILTITLTIISPLIKFLLKSAYTNTQNQQEVIKTQITQTIQHKNKQKTEFVT